MFQCSVTVQKPYRVISYEPALALNVGFYLKKLVFARRSGWSESENAQTRGCRSLPKIPKDPAERGRKEPALGKSTGSAALNCVIYISSPWFGCL